jgi:pimeloyl-ACP methyl ester carboxylesterase
MLKFASDLVAYFDRIGEMGDPTEANQLLGAPTITLDEWIKGRQAETKVPLLLVLGEKDNLVGNPEAARALVQDIPDIQVEVLDTGHLIGAEQPEQVNKLILQFFEGR